MSGGKHRILVVEDAFLVAQGVCEVLRGAGYLAESASDGASARSLAARWRPDLAVVDLALRDRFDGIETARGLAREVGVRIVFLSAYEPGILPEAERAACREIGAGFVGKPPDAGSLLAAVRAALAEC